MKIFSITIRLALVILALARPFAAQAAADNLVKANAVIFSTTLHDKHVVKKLPKEKLEKELNAAVYEVIKKITQEGFHVGLFQADEAPDDVRSNLENYFIDVSLGFKDGNALNPPVDYILVTVTPSFSGSFQNPEIDSMGVSTSAYGAPFVLSLGDNWGLFLNEYKKTITPVLTDALRRGVCGKKENRQNNFCKSLCLNLTDLVDVNWSIKCKEGK